MVCCYKQQKKTFGVPRNTIRCHTKGRVKSYGGGVGGGGGMVVLSSDQEDALVKRALYLSQRGFPITIDDLCKAAYCYAKKLRRRKELGPLHNLGCQMEMYHTIGLRAFAREILRYPYVSPRIYQWRVQKLSISFRSNSSSKT